jgi:hypothetical protein
MGYELWTSPITGYRRKGTRLEELRSLLGAGITGHAILEPLQSCPADAEAIEIATVLQDRDFDVAGVQLRPDGPVIGWITRDCLRDRKVRDHMKPITADTLVSDATPLPSVLTVLKGRSHIFVLVGTEVRGIITRADFNKPPVRVYLFGLLSLLEMHLGFWIRAVYADSWQTVLPPTRLVEAKKRQADRKKRKQNVSLVECLQFCDKRDLVVVRQDLCEKLRFGSKTKASHHLRHAEDLRNLLAHSHQDLVKGSSWETVIGLVEWIEIVVHASDQHVEQEARNAAELGQDTLWSSV